MARRARLFSLFLSSLLIGTLLPVAASVPVSAQTDPAPVPATGPEEVASERTRFAKVFDNADGTHTTEIYSDPIHYQVSPGEWEEIDNTVVEQPDGSGFEKQAGELGASFAASGAAERLVTLEDSGATLAYGLEGAAPVEPVTDANTITYHDVYPGVDVGFELTGEDIKESLVLKARPQLDSDDLRLSFPLELSGVTIDERPSGELRFLSPAGKVVFDMPQMYMFDSSEEGRSGDPQSSGAIELSVGRAGDDIELVADVDGAWLSDPERVYPVTIDPTVGPFYPSLDTFVQSNIQNTGQSGSSVLKSGYYSGPEGTFTARSLLKFDLSSIPQGADVSAADLALYENHSYSCSARIVDVYRVTESWGSGVTWPNRPAFAPDPQDSLSVAKGYSSACPSGRIHFDVAGTVGYWKQPDVPNYGFGIRARNESDTYGWKKFKSDNNTTEKPRLEVTYTEPNRAPYTPDQLSPADGTVDPDPTPRLEARFRDPDTDDRGYVDFRLLNASGTVVQSARKGSFCNGCGPADWTPSALGEGATYTWQARNEDTGGLQSSWTQARSYKVKLAGPDITSVGSSTHPSEATWYRADNPTLEWSATDASEISGYAIALNSDPNHVLADNIDVAGSGTNDDASYSFGPQPSGLYYFHVKARDELGNWGAQARRTVRIDTTPPSNPQPQSGSHPSPTTWYQSNDPSFSWGSGDSHSGMAGYSLALDSVPDDTLDAHEEGPSQRYFDVADGSHTFSVKARDNAGNFTGVQSVTIRVDASAPSTPSVSSSTHPVEGTYYASDDVELQWSASDPHSGVSGYSYVLNQDATTIPDQASEGSGTSRSYDDLEPGTHYFHVRAVNAAGSWGGTRHFEIRIDSQGPSAPQVSSSHPEGGWSNDPTPSFTWTEPTSLSGVTGYSYVLDQSSATTPDDGSEGAARSASYDSDQPEGVSYFHVKARSGAGVWGDTAHYAIGIDHTPPGEPPAVTSTSHVAGVAFADDTVDMTWGPSDDQGLSGVASYEYAFAPEGASPDWAACVCETTPEERQASSAELDDGRYTFYVRATDAAQNTGAPADYGPLIVDQNGSVIPLNPSLSDALVAQSDTAGMEQFYPYSRSPLGTAAAFTNLFSGNLVVRQRLGTVPAKGLNTSLNLTYNSQRSDASYHDTGTGRGWSLSVSDLDAGSDFAAGLTEVDLNAPVVVSLADVVGGAAGVTGGVVELTDGDGTTHRFIRKGEPGTRWESPPGVDLKVKENLDPATGSAASYDLIRPDGVVYTAGRDILEDGSLSDTWHIGSISDRNQNRLEFRYRRITNPRSLTDARVTKITHQTGSGAGRGLVARFDYDEVSADNPSGTGALKTVTTLPGTTGERVHALAVDSEGRLTSVTRNDHVTSGTARQTTGFDYACHDDPDGIEDCDPSLELPQRELLLVGVTDARNNRSSFEHSAATGEWRHTELTDRAGEPWAISYGAAEPNTGARTTELTSPAGATTGYDISGRGAVSADDPRSAGGNITAISDQGTTDESGTSQGPVTLDYEWRANRMVAKRDGAQNETTMTYNDLGLVTEVTSPATNSGGERVTTSFDYSPVTSYSYGSDCTAPADDGDRVTTAMWCDTVAELDRTVAAQGSGEARATDFDYDAAGNLLGVIARSDAATGHGEARQAGDRQTTMTYTSWGGLTSVDGPRFTDPPDVTNFSDYHDSGQPATITDAYGEDISLTYDPYGQPTLVTDRGGRVTTTTYDDLDRPLEAKSPDGDVTSFSYDANGNRSTTTSPRGTATTAEPDDFTTSVSYDAMDRPLRVSSPGTTSGEPIVTSTAYAPDGAVTQETNPVDGATTFAYHPNRALKKTTVPVTGGLEAVTEHYYDTAGRPRKVVAPVTNAAGDRPVTTTSYTPSSGVASSSSTNWQGPPRVVDYSYDSFGGVTQVTGPRDGQLRSQSYDSFGQPTAMTTKVSDSKTLSYSYGYDLAGNKTSYVQPHGSGQTMTTSFAYDSLGRLVAQSDPINEGHSTEYSYLAEGQQTERRDYFTPSGGSQQLKRLIASTYNLDYTLRSLTSTDKAAAGEPTLALYNYPEGGEPSAGYDENDNLLASHTMCSGASEATGTLDDCPTTGVTLRTMTMSYDHADRMAELTQSIDTPGEAAPVSRTQSLDYREDSTVASSTWDGHTTTYAHSQGGFLTQMTDWRAGAEPSTMAYLASGATTSATLAGGLATESLAYHPDGSVASLSWEASGMGSPVREHEDITYNAAGLRTSEQVAIEATGAGDDPGGPASFDYDLAGRLTEWTSPFRLEFGELDGPDSPTTSYTLDDAGNITRQEVTTEGRAEPWEVVTAEFTNARLDHRRVVADSTVEVTGGLGDQTLTATTDQDFDYSALGEETGRDATTSYAVTGDIDAPADDTLATDTSYDPAGTTRAQRHSGTVDDKPTDPTYFYDASGQVIARKTDQKATYLFYFAGSSRLAEEAKPDGTTRTRFLNAPSGKVVAEQRVEDDQWVWLLSDPDGNVATELKETTGDPTVKRQRAYDPYGSPDEGGTTDEPLTGPESKSSLGYQSDNTDEDTGNLLLGPRLYDPEVNRFTSPDVFAAGGADMALGTDPLTGNRFMFAAANPVAFYEDGHRPACDSGGGQQCRWVDYRAGQKATHGTFNPETRTWQAEWNEQAYQMVPSNYVPDTSFQDVCTILGPCALADDIKTGNYGGALLEAAMMLPWGKVGKLGKLFKRADDVGDATRGVSATIHGAERLTQAGFTDELISLTKSDQVFRQGVDDATVYLREVTPDRFDFIVEAERGIITAHRNWSLKSIERIAQNYEWQWRP